MILNERCRFGARFECFVVFVAAAFAKYYFHFGETTRFFFVVFASRVFYDLFFYKITHCPVKARVTQARQKFPIRHIYKTHVFGFMKSNYYFMDI